MAAPGAHVYNRGVQSALCIRLAAVVLLLTLGGSPGFADEAGGQLALENLSGEVVDPWAMESARAVVFIFTGTQCPISNRYAPEVRRIHEIFSARGIRFWLVYPDARDSAEMIRTHLDAYGHPMPGLRDPGQSLVQMTGATVTPETVVFSPDRELLYRGRIDNRYVAFGKVRRRPTTRDLDAALEDILAGRPVAEPRTQAIGCYIPSVDR